MPEPRELEIKLDIELSDIASLKETSLPQLTTAQPATRRLTSVYFDTPKHVLRKHGFSLRVRCEGAARLQTIKRSAVGVGLFDRAEWETEIQGDEPDLAAAEATPLGVVLQGHRQLTPMFETVVDRTTWLVDRGDSTIEVALDEGRIVAGTASCPITEVELELKRGSAADLFGVIHALTATHPLKLGASTKSERGYALVRGRPPQAYKAEPVALTPEMTAGQSFQAIARACIRQFRLNEPLVIETRRPEALHQARVAIRRLRSALSLFKPIVADSALEGLKTRLREVSLELGEARNLDVYLSRAARPEAERAVSEPGIAAFVTEIEHNREQAYDQLTRTLQSPAFGSLMLDLLAWTEAGPWLVTTDPYQRLQREQPVRIFAAGLLDRRRRKVRKKGQELDKLEPEARHRVRIHAKKLRYAAEFFASLMRAKDQRHYAKFIAGMESLQEILGDLNDIQTGHEIAEEVARHVLEVETAPDSALFAAGHVSGEQDAGAARLLQSAVEAHQHFAGTKRFWAKWT